MGDREGEVKADLCAHLHGVTVPASMLQLSLKMKISSFVQPLNCTALALQALSKQTAFLFFKKPFGICWDIRGKRLSTINTPLCTQETHL